MIMIPTIYCLGKGGTETLTCKASSGSSFSLPLSLAWLNLLVASKSVYSEELTRDQIVHA